MKTAYISTTSTPLSFLRLATVIERTGLGKSTIYALIAKSEFPDSIQTSSGTVGWSSVEIENWIIARLNTPKIPRKALVAKRLRRTAEAATSV